MVSVIVNKMIGNIGLVNSRHRWTHLSRSFTTFNAILGSCVRYDICH